MLRSDNVLINFNDYTPVDIVSPIDGQVFTVYNLLASKQGLVDTIDVNSPDPELRSRTYNGFEMGFNGRYGPASFFGGWTFDRLVSVNCDSIHDPNQTIGGIVQHDDGVV